MPYDGSMGYSANTSVKEDHLGRLLKTHMSVVKSILQRHHSWVSPTYLYIDLNAGKGRYSIDGHSFYGSPLIACAVAQAFDVPLQAVFCERDSQTLQYLYQELIAFGFSRIPGQDNLFHNSRTITATVCPGDYQDSASSLLAHLQQEQVGQRYGLIYSDENGSFPPFTLLSRYAKTLHYFDIVIHVAASPIKWQVVSSKHQLTQRLDELVQTIEKTYWIIRRPYGPQQWTFLIGTNWDAFPKFHNQGFWSIDSPEGASILRKLSWSTKERDTHLQANLFGQKIL